MNPSSPSISRLPDIRELILHRHKEMSPQVYYTLEQAEAASREWHTGRSPYPATELVREVRDFISKGWLYWKTRIPDSHEWRNPERRRVFEDFIRNSPFHHLGQYYALTRDLKAAELARDLLHRIVERHSTWPCSPITYIGSDYTGRLGQWRDSITLNHAAYVAWGIQPSGLLSSIFFNDFSNRFARDIIEINTLPILDYLMDKYHNAMTDVYETLLLTGHLLGDRLRVKDLLDPARSFTGTELAEYAWSGPKGLLYFVENAFGHEGSYWELSSTYTMHCLHYLFPSLQLARISGRKIPSNTLHRLGLVTYELTQEVFPTGDFPPVSETHFGRHAYPSITEIGAFLTEHSKLRQRSPVLLRLRELHDPTSKMDWGKLIHRIFLPETRRFQSSSKFLSWSDHLNPSIGQLISRSKKGEFAVHLGWDAYQDYHSDRDVLSICLQFCGRIRVLDFGYFIPGNPLRSWVRRTRSHSTVIMNDEDQVASMRFGRLESYRSGSNFTWIKVSAPHVYSEAKVYRRSMLILKSEPWMVVDLFEVEGGWGHDYLLNGIGQPSLRQIRDSCFFQCSWRDDDGVELLSECFTNGPCQAELRPLLPEQPFQKLALIRRGTSPLRSIFVNILTLDKKCAHASKAKVSFSQKGIHLLLPPRKGRNTLKLDLSFGDTAPAILRIGKASHLLKPWRGVQGTLSRTIHFQIEKVLDSKTLQTLCMACWPLEKGMTFQLKGRHYTLEAWQFSGSANRLPIERSAFERRRLRLRFHGDRPLRKSDVGSVVKMIPPKKASNPVHPI